MVPRNSHGSIARNGCFKRPHADIYIYIYIHPLLREFKSEAAEFQGTRENVYATEMMASTYRGGRREGTCDNGLCGKGGPVDNDYYCDQGCALVDYQVAGRSFSWHCLR